MAITTGRYDAVVAVRRRLSAAWVSAGSRRSKRLRVKEACRAVGTAVAASEEPVEAGNGAGESGRGLLSTASRFGSGQPFSDPVGPVRVAGLANQEALRRAIAQEQQTLEKLQAQTWDVRLHEAEDGTRHVLFPKGALGENWRWTVQGQPALLLSSE